jgi:hypothetical protein
MRRLRAGSQTCVACGLLSISMPKAKVPFNPSVGRRA